MSLTEVAYPSFYSLLERHSSSLEHTQEGIDYHRVAVKVSHSVLVTPGFALMELVRDFSSFTSFCNGINNNKSAVMFPGKTF